MMKIDFLLAIDIGNTNVKFGLWDGTAWRHIWRVRTVAEKSLDEYAALLRGFDLNAVVGVVISSVVPMLTPVFVDLVRKYWGLEALVVSGKTPLGLRLALDQPESVGADRLLNAAAAAALYGVPVIAVDFGTATKFDVVTREGVYCGGAIAPGIGVAHEALISRAALLQRVDIVPPPSPVGSNTSHALQSGIFWGYIALCDNMVARLKAAMREDRITVVATGGLAPLIQQHTTTLDFSAPHLTLDGLRLAYEHAP
jgi:type III pantothenate kinase